ncbi:hypothetical protein MRB53_027878 [Persea americana]|uniref:Uncharacterized protein n=1 Tax=Persea americana TaxID=3435 RepID=A0ACC2KEG2_PERAE|nr:hypothetical protein MRB53_027878 [Persea americana]
MPPSLPADLVKPSISLLPEPAITNNNGSLSNSTRIFNVQSFGAVGDTVTDDTQAFKSAWEMACQVKSAILLVPHGYSFMIQPMIFAGPCQNGLTFQVNGVLMPPDLLDSWPKNNSRQQWLVFYRMEGMSLQGGGTIDGKGEKWWNLPYKPHKGHENIRGTYDVRSPPIHLACSDTIPCTNLTLAEVELLPSKGDIVSDPLCWNAYGRSETLTIPPISCLLKGLPQSITANRG